MGVIISAFHRIVIEDDVLVAPYVCIIDNSAKAGGTHQSLSEEDIQVGPVHIGTGSWLAYNVCVLPNVKIGRHCLIGALSVVNSNIPPYSVAVGCPVRIVKRFDFNRKV